MSAPLARISSGVEDGEAAALGKVGGGSKGYEMGWRGILKGLAAALGMERRYFRLRQGILVDSGRGKC